MKKLNSRFLQWAFLILSILLCVIVLVWLKAVIDKNIKTVRNDIISRLENQLEADIRYQSISPALLSAVTIRGLSVDFASGQFTADKIRVFYNPFKRKISRIGISDGSLFMKLDNPRNKTVSADNESLPWDLIIDKTVTVRNVAVQAGIQPETVYSGQIERMELKHSAENIRYLLETTAGVVFGAEDTKNQIELELGSRGSFSPESKYFNGRVDLRKGTNEKLELMPMSVDISFAEDQFQFRRIGDAVPLDISGRYEKGQWSVSCETEQMPLKEVLRPLNYEYLEEAAFSWPEMLLNGRFDVRGEDSNVTDYNIALQLNEKKDGGLQAEFKAGGDSLAARIDILSVSALNSKVQYTGVFRIPEMAPVGLLSAYLDENVLGYPVSGVFDVQYADNIVKVFPSEVQAGNLSFNDFRFIFIREKDMLTATLLAVPETKNKLSDSRIVLDAAMKRGKNPFLKCFFSLEGINSTLPLGLAGLSSLSALPVLGQSSLDVSGAFEVNESAWAFNISQARLVSLKNAENTVSLAGRLSPGRWDLDGFHLNWDNYRIDGHLAGSQNSKGGEINGRFLLEDQIFPIKGSWDTNGNVRITEGGFLTLNSQLKNEGGRNFSLNMDNLKLPVPYGLLTVNADVQGLLAPGDWRIRLRDVSLAAEGDNNTNMVFLLKNGFATPYKIDLPVLTYRDRTGALNGSSFVQKDRFSNDISGELLLQNPESPEYYQFLFKRQNNMWDNSFNVISAQMERLGQNRLSGSADASGKMTGLLSNPSFSMRLSTSEARLDNRPLNVAAGLSFHDGRLRIQDCIFNYEGLSVSRGLVLYNKPDNSLRCTAELDGHFNEEFFSTGFSLALDLDSSQSMLDLLNNWSALDFTGTLATRPLLWNSMEHMPSFTFQFENSADNFRVTSPQGKILKINYSREDGSLNVTAGKPLPVIVRGGGYAGADYLNLSFPSIEIDPVLINYVMPRDPILRQYYVIFQGGKFLGNMSVKGSSENPQLFGEIKADKIKVDTPYTYAEIGTGDTTISFEGNQVTIDRIEVPVGGGFVYGEGYFVMDRWSSLTDFNMRYGAQGGPQSRGVQAYYPLMNVTLDGLFFGEIQMIGDGQSFFLDGSFTFPELRSGLGTPAEPVQGNNDNLYPVYLDIDFITGNNCTFFLPNEQLKIVRATAEPNQVVNLTYSTNPETMSFTGKLPIKSGNINYFDREFQVTRGYMDFNENLEDFNPLLSFRAETRVKDDANEEITVALVYKAPIMSDFNPRVETVPARRERDIMALLGQSVVPYNEQSEVSTTNSMFLGTGSMFAEAGIVHPFEQVLRESLNLDMLTIRTDIIENALSGGFAQNVDSSYASGLGRYLDNTSLFAGKYIGNALFVSGSLEANYFEGRRNRSTFGGLEFETSVNFEMQTPFFDVMWSYSPSSSIKQNFVADNQISLKWQFSY
ncbi:MAG: hypothetical protein CSA76_05895 [Spirochaetales bacterium]|nr:MAG: hypothetical protein CSA76_05895 [Spirochaetales bacterium]